jgi:hypothetical protein
MTFVFPAAALFLAIVFVTIKWAAHKIWHAAAAFLAGFFVAATGAAPYIDKAVSAVDHTLAHVGRN